MNVDSNERSHPILLFDGVCNLCNRSVQLVLKADKENRFRFASIQSDAGQEILKQFKLDRSDIDSVVLVDGQGAHVKSMAALRVMYHLGGGYRLLFVLRGCPRFIRDRIYDWIARNRYAWFGKRDVCMIPTPELKDRFLD